MEPEPLLMDDPTKPKMKLCKRQNSSERLKPRFEEAKNNQNRRR
jgi:hypothetical protein